MILKTEKPMRAATDSRVICPATEHVIYCNQAGELKQITKYHSAARRGQIQKLDYKKTKIGTLTAYYSVQT